MQIGQHFFDTEHEIYVVGILNVTPDSFSDGGKWTTPDAALFRAEQMKNEGAAILDVGGESTRPGYEAVAEAEEIERTAPVIEAIKARIDIPVSIDTSKSAVARSALSAGADMVNDIWGFKGDEALAGTVAAAGAACCLMHNRTDAGYTDFFGELLADLRESIAIAERVGVERGKVIVDPGVGFAKSHGQNLEAIRRAGELRQLGCPVLLGASRKSVIGTVLGADVSGRLEGTIAVSVYAALQGCAFVRVHDVKENVLALHMVREILRG